MPVNIPLLGLGTWGMGGKFERDESNWQESLEALRYGLSLGFWLIDTAEMYGLGATEEIVGEAIRRMPREEIFLVSKVWKDHLRYDDVIKAAKQSLTRLKTDYLDLYLVHWPNETIPLSETMPAMEELVKQGLVKNIGVSNFSVPLLEEAMRYLKNTPIVANEIEYNLSNQSANKDVVHFCKNNNIKIIAYRPLARGSLNTASTNLVAELAKKYQKTPGQIALNWLISQDMVAIPKATSKIHLEENWGALGWKMEEEDIVALKE